MILVTIGTNEQPFDRLVRAATLLGGGERLVVQHGSSRIVGDTGEWVDYMSFDTLAAHMREARVVVCHAGVGSIMLARSCGRRPIVVPRRLHLGEAVDDHQLGLARRLHATGVVELVEDAAELPARVAAADGGAVATAASAGADALAADLRDYLVPLVRGVSSP